ncbi:WXG100 family type VII secretion target [Nocardia ignorata]|uniref:ESAT-6-like protein n=1 Tax=Nocardia ignorata TaxID=145285 RepID=A0A4V3CQP3_NOCIG|nr:WXG100 family type VII secretion target [Nocardia ignorata]TDP42819.1 WXG100 family type VII secretion target [Nocardia ignorata]
MSNQLHVEPWRLRDAASKIATKAQVIRDKVTALDNTVGKELLADGWMGQAASAYDESWVEWKAGADAIVAALEESSSKLVYAANQYEMQDAASSAAIDRAGTTLNL